MKKVLSTIACMVLAVGLALPAVAQAGEEKPKKTRNYRMPKKPHCFGGNFTGDPGVITPKGLLGTVTEYITFDKDEVYSGTSDKSSRADNSGIKEKTGDVMVFKAKYGLTKKIDLRFGIPYFKKGVDWLNTPERDDDITGVGDAQAIFKYGLTRQSMKGAKGAPPFDSAVGLMLKIPTGSTKDSIPTMTRYWPVGAQVGTGSWDYGVQAGIRKRIRAKNDWSIHRFDLGLKYWIRNEGDRDFEKGDSFHYDFHYGYGINHLFDVGFEINGVWQDKDKDHRGENRNTGGSHIWAGPQFRIKYMKQPIFLVFSPQYQIFRDVNGTQLTADWRFKVKLACYFF